MKTIKSVSTVLLAVLAALALTACTITIGRPSQSTEDDDPPLTRVDPGEQEPSASAGPELGDILALLGGGNSEEARQAIIEAAKAQGYEAFYGEDGSLILKGADGTTLVQGPDGSWSMQGSGEGTPQLGGEWPENEYTRQVPKPGLPIYASSLEEDSFSVVFSGAELGSVKAYAASLKAAGFTLEAEEQEQSLYGVSMYTYVAENAGGFRVSLYFASGTGGLTISQ